MSFAAVAGSVVSGFIGSRSAKKQRDATAKAQREELLAQRPNQYGPWGSLEWNKDDKGNWTQKAALQGQDAERLAQYRDIAWNRMNKAKSFLHDPSEYKIDYGWAGRQPGLNPGLGALYGSMGGGAIGQASTFSNPLSHFYTGPGGPPQIQSAPGAQSSMSTAPTAPTAGLIAPVDQMRRQPLPMDMSYGGG